MIKHKSFLKKWLNYIHEAGSKPEFWITGGIFCILAVVFYINTFHEKFTDEFDNILGGYYILQGRLPYTGFFSHHGPFPYYLAAFIEIFSGNSFVLFRIFYSIFLFFVTIGGYLFIRFSLGVQKAFYYLLFIVILGISATYFWGHMLVADSLAAFLLAPAISLLFLKGFYKEKITSLELGIVSLLLAASLLTTLTFIYLIAGAYLFITILELNGKLRTVFSSQFWKTIIILGIPYILFLIYLFFTNSFSEYITQGIMFNQKYYIYNYPRPEGVTATTINPLRYAIVISYEFYKNFRDVLLQLKDFNFNFPLNVTLAFANFVILIYLLIKKKFLLFLFMLFVLVFSNARSNPLTSKEKDFQAAVYIVLSMSSACFILVKLWRELKKNLEPTYRVLYSILFFTLALYGLYSFSYLFFGFLTKSYNKYMGFEPRIYDRPEISPILQSITYKKEKVWIGPIEFEELLYLNRPLPSKYQILIPGMGRSRKMLNDMIQEYSSNKPLLIWFDKRYYILGQNPEEFAPDFINFLNNNYVTLYNEKTNKKEYNSRIPRSGKVDLETKLYIRRDKYQEIVKRLLAQGLIKRVEK